MTALTVRFFGMRIQNGKTMVSAIKKAITRTYVQFMQARQIARERALLAQLTDAQLKDIGLSRYEATKEADRSFWDIPATKR